MGSPVLMRENLFYLSEMYDLEPEEILEAIDEIQEYQLLESLGYDI